MTYSEAAAIMMSGSGGSMDPIIPDSITYKDTGDSQATLTEKYSDGTTKKVEVALSNKGTINEQVMGLTFYNTAGEKVKQISFNGFYVG